MANVNKIVRRRQLALFIALVLGIPTPLLKAGITVA